MEHIIDAKDLLVGRMATKIAKQALLGESFVVVNCEQAAISGRKEIVLERWLHRMEMGQPTKGPFVPRRPDMFVRRMIKGMLPHKQVKGREAFARIMCYIGVPKEYEGKTLETVEGAHVDKLPNLRFITISDLCKEIGGYHG